METKVMKLEIAQPTTETVRKLNPRPLPSGAFDEIYRREVESLSESRAKVCEQLGELSTLLTMMSEEVRLANERTAKVEAENAALREVSTAILKHRQFEMAPLRELLDELKYLPLDARLAKLLANVELSIKGS